MRTVLSRMTRLIIPPRFKKSSLSPTVRTGRSFTAARISSTLRFSLPLTKSSRHCRQTLTPSQCWRTTVRPSIVLDFTSDDRDVPNRSLPTRPICNGAFVSDSVAGGHSTYFKKVQQQDGFGLALRGGWGLLSERGTRGPARGGEQCEQPHMAHERKQCFAPAQPAAACGPCRRV